MIDGDSVQPASRQETFPWRAVGYYRHKGYWFQREFVVVVVVVVVVPPCRAMGWTLKKRNVYDGDRSLRRSAQGA